MPRFHFEIINGYRIPDPVGLDCESEDQAKKVADDIARQIAIEVSSAAGRHVVVVDDDGKEIYRARVNSR
jgi:hypothetical protein